MVHKKIDLAATVATLIIMVTICAIIIHLLSLSDRAQLGIYIFMIPVSLFFIYEWHSEKSFDRKDYLYGVLFGVIWIIVGIVWIANTYNIDIKSLLFFRKEAWDQVGYIGIFGIGPIIVIHSVLSIVRDIMILKLKGWK